jgi:hypothetical protein
MCLAPARANRGLKEATMRSTTSVLIGLTILAVAATTAAVASRSSGIPADTFRGMPQYTLSQAQVEQAKGYGLAHVHFPKQIIHTADGSIRFATLTSPGQVQAALDSGQEVQYPDE